MGVISDCIAIGIFSNFFYAVKTMELLKAYRTNTNNSHKFIYILIIFHVAVSYSQDLAGDTYFINKCCPLFHSYDHTERFCTQSLNFNSYFRQLFGNDAVVIENTVPDCAEDEVFVEYFSTIHNIHFDGMNLKVDNYELPSNKFCIDNLVNINPIELTEGGIHLVVRSCRPNSICNEIPCFRRCCKTDQILRKGRRSKECVPHQKNLVPIFYDVEPPITNPQKQISLRGMGFN